MVTGLATVFVYALALSDPAGPITGTIEGVVVNASQGNSPVAQAEVILQVRLEGEFAPVEKTQSDALGRFRFDKLPVGPEAEYLPVQREMKFSIQDGVLSCRPPNALPI